MMRRVWIAIAFVAALQAQTPKFDAASLKWTPDGARFTPPSGGPGTPDMEHFAWQTATVSLLIARAYGVAADQITGPDWISTQHCSIAANAPAGTTADQFSSMLQNLLAERLGLTVHHESKTIDGYNLVVAKGGSKLKDAGPGDLSQPNVTARAQFGQDGATVAYPRATMQMFANDVGVRINQFNDGPARITRVMDKTRLAGTYDITLHYVPAGMDDVLGPDIFAAIESQVGLKLEPTKMQIDMVVIDHIERAPSEN